MFKVISVVVFPSGSVQCEMKTNKQAENKNAYYNQKILTTGCLFSKPSPASANDYRFSSCRLTSLVWYVITVVLNLFHCWDPLNATDVVWDPQVKIEKVCAPE